MRPIAIVHCSGYSLEMNPELDAVEKKTGAQKPKFSDWEHVCWGDETRQLMGRIPMTLWLAKNIGAKHVIWSSGYSRLKPSGITESEFFFETALESFDRLRKAFPKRFADGPWRTERSFKRWLTETSAFDTESTNTATSMEQLTTIVKQLVGRSPSHVYLVSSANHVQRVLRDALTAFNLDGSARHTLSAVPAETSYGGKTPEDVVIKELGQQ